MKKTAVSFAILLLSFWSNSQVQGDGGVPSFFASQEDMAEADLLNTGLPEVVFPKPDIKKLRAEDAVNDEKGTGPWRFGFNHETNLTLENSGTWFPSDGGKLWLLKIKCQDAQTVNLTFENTRIPEGNRLYAYNTDQSSVLGKFTQKHLYKGQLGTELLTGESVIVEYYVAPENMDNPGELTISTVTHGYRFFEEFYAKSFGQAGACNMNVNCPDGAPFSNQKRSVVLLVSGSNGLCSGALINNTQYDGKPYVLTANHCYNSNLPSWVFRFNWESPDCNNPSTSPPYSSLSGAELKARRIGSDFLLVEITGGLESGTIPASYNAYFSGWDRTGEEPDWTVGIHHPRGDIKKISFDDDASSATQATITATSDPYGVWKVVWDRNTTTEQVSSGSPLFDQNKRIIGQLWGGQASCTNLTGPDFYGRVYTSWNPSGSDSTNQLEHWLDPSGTGAFVVDGYEPGTIVVNDGALMLVKDAKGTFCSNDIAPKFTLVNMGVTTLLSATISYGFDGIESFTYNWTGNLPFLGSEEITLPVVTLSGGSHTFSATITAVNGGTDEIGDNNTASSSFYIMEDPKAIDLSLTLECYASETSWELINSEDVVLYKSPVYMNSDEGTHNYSFCLSEDCYTFIIYDSYGDGMRYCDSGKYQITNAGNVVLAEMTTAQSVFTYSFEREFCLGEASLEKLSNQLLVYPNPTSGTVHWDSDDVESVCVYDINGKELFRKPVDLQTKKLNLNDLSDGVYLVGFEFRNGSRSQSRIVVLRE